MRGLREHIQCPQFFSRTSKIASKQKFYAVVGGLGGFSGIVTDWDSQAFRLTNRVSGVRHKKFAQEREAREPDAVDRTSAS